MLFLFCVVSFGAFAVQIPESRYTIPGSVLMGATPFQFSKTCLGIGLSTLAQLNTTNKKTSIQNTVELVLKNPSALNLNGKVNVAIELTYNLINNAVPVTTNITLELKYKSGALTKSDVSSIYAFKNAYQVDLKITSVSVVPDGGGNQVQATDRLKNFIQLDLSFQEEQVSRIDYAAIPANVGACEDPGTDELVFHWEALPGAEGYDLEYTFIDDYTDSYNGHVPTANLFFDFTSNSTRISTTNLYYRAPLLFERGYILYRVRATGKGGVQLDLPVSCIWTGPDKGTVNNFSNLFYHSTAHVQDKMNWQAITDFAEEGKRNDRIKYFDGSFRNRQTLSGVNLDPQLPVPPPLASQACFAPGNEKIREVIAAETIYDYTGRPAIEIMPVPTDSRILTFLPLLNISDVPNAPSTVRKPYSWKDFDKAGINCGPPHPMSSLPAAITGVMGAAAYYSADNPNRAGFNSFIPSSGGYPFKQTSYLEDNSESPAAKSHAGPEFQLGSGHETRYYYGSPDQEELDRLFGTEAGDASRYKKTAQMDANGQVTVSYHNPEGKVIASALAGEAPTSLQPLEGQNPNNVTISLMGKNVRNTDDATLITEHPFIVTSPNTPYKIHYDLFPAVLHDTSCNGAKVCMDCIYDLSVTLTHIESCSGVPLINYTGTIGQLINASGEVDFSCLSATGGTSKDTLFNLVLQTGSYQLTKKLSVNQAAAQSYLDAIVKDTCEYKWETILNNQLARIDTTSCYESCTKCAQPLLPSPVCDTAYCKPNPNRCDIIRSMMLADVTPGGQYAQFTRNADGTIDAGAYPLSVFNPANLLLPAGSNIINLSQFSQVNSYSDLVNNWRPEYAEKLLPMHPEFCLLGWCKEPGIDTTLHFNVQILGTPHFADAVTKGYTAAGTPLPNTQQKPYEYLLSKDPLFLNGQNATMKNQLLQRLLHYGCGNGAPSVDQLAMEMAWCSSNNPPGNPQTGNPQIQAGASSCTVPSNYLSTHGFGTTNNLADMEWTNLRTFYTSAKDQVLRINMNQYQDTHGCNTRCIGSKDFPLSGPAFAPCQGSIISWAWIFFREKESRFGAGAAGILRQLAESGVTVDISSITDPDDPCQIQTAIQNQANSINQQLNRLSCNDSTCRFKDSLPDIINTIIDKLQTVNFLTLQGAELTQVIRSAGITSISATRGPDRITIDFGNCKLQLPFLNSSPSPLAPVSVCCITQLKCTAGAGCSFNIQVNYPFGKVNVVPVKLGCTFFSGCTDSIQPVCNLLSVYGKAVKDYLNMLFAYMSVNRVEPSTQQLIAWLPSILHTDAASGNNVINATMQVNGDLVISLVYGRPGGKDKVCRIVLKRPAGIDSWFEVRQLTGFFPDLTGVANGYTTSFTIKTITGTSPNNARILTISGEDNCHQMNDCPKPGLLCDSVPTSIYFIPVNECARQMIATAYSNATVLYNQWLETWKDDLLKRYYAKCLAPVEKFDLSYINKEYQYTLFYYDLAGNIIKSVPPAGVVILDHAAVQSVAVSRGAGYSTNVLPAHFKSTAYRYNTLELVTWQSTPDGGITNFYYDALGRVAASQNARQQPANQFSYSCYDRSGRIIETGQLTSTQLNRAMARNFSTWSAFIAHQTSKKEIVLTKYDEAFDASINTKFGAAGQQNLRTRVASVLSFQDATDLGSGVYRHATHYSYDIEGFVQVLVQDYPNGIIGDKKVVYGYDLQSGKINSVTYQKDAPDQFMHRYHYDGANRMTEVMTSRNGLIWDSDARYLYYRHGDIARLELGTDSVQGLDYFYALNGWLKGVNGTSDIADNDMGRDGASSNNSIGYASNHINVGRDAFAYVLDYYIGDYNAVRTNSFLTPLQTHTGAYTGLFNGMITGMYTQLQSIGNSGFNYAYDQLNRLVTQQGWKLAGNTTQLLSGSEYRVELAYDKDGNIARHMRNGVQPVVAMDNMSYFYYDRTGAVYNAASTTIPLTASNRLAFIKDAVPSANYATDLDGQPYGNYTYDEIGNLTDDLSEQLHLDWNSRNKIVQVRKGSSTRLDFEYDATGNRVMKRINTNGSSRKETLFYVRDAVGKVLGVYSHSVSSVGGSLAGQLYFKEAHIYGNARIGIHTPGAQLPLASQNTVSIANVFPTEGGFSASRGERQYELNNHSGNVMATITDRKIPDPSGPGFLADLVSAQDYYPFGMEMPNRKIAGGEYRYGFGAKEKIDETQGNANYYDFEARMYDPRVGRTSSTDPNAAEFPALSPYSFLANNPVNVTDQFGKDAVYITFPKYKANGYPYTGHAGVLLIDNKTGKAHYYEYGRYDKKQIGLVKDYEIQGIIMGSDGRPTPASLNNALQVISKSSGKSQEVEGAYITSDKFKEMNNYAKGKLKENNDPKRKPYSITGNNCGTFAADVVNQDKDLDSPTIVDPRPVSIVGEFQDNFTPVHFDPAKGTTIEYSEKTVEYNSKTKKTISSQSFIQKVVNGDKTSEKPKEKSSDKPKKQKK